MTIERNQVYKMDCIKGLQEMLQGGVQADCIITDPPYLINYKSNHRHNKDHKFCKTIQNDNNPQLIIDLMPLLYEVLKDNAPLYMFCGSDNIDFFVQEVKKYFKEKVYTTVIPRNVRFAEAPSYGMPIMKYDPKSAGAVAYQEFAEEFLSLEDE